MTARSIQMNTWLDSLGYRDYNLAPASEDASFRSYHRLQLQGQSFIVMDAPPEQEPCEQFIKIAKKLRAVDLNAPEIIAQNEQQGFLLLSDFGSTDYLTALNDASEAGLYGDALAALLQMQTRIKSDDLPPYDESLLNREMDLFHDWFLQQMLAIELSPSQYDRWLSIKQALVGNALEQPQVFVHRDYHSRNLMKVDGQNPGILDFQDAVRGPITYDLVSLLRDCYVDWPPARVDELVAGYYKLVVDRELITDVDQQTFKRWFNLTGVQRHLKAIGIFSRLNIRDGKSAYMKSIPRTLQYVVDACGEEGRMSELSLLLTELDIEQGVKTLS